MDSFFLPKNARIGVGVSGGADSLLLSMLLNEWCQKTGRKLVAITVDHNLRPESAEEARQVSTHMENLHIEHHILTYTGKKPTSRIEEKAREIRYTLLEQFCTQNKVKYLCLAHHSNDQAETFFARLARGSGVDGLCAIHPTSQRKKLVLLRPLLDTEKADIENTLKSLGITWIEDPMNSDTTFERVRWRNHLKTLWQTGLTKSGILLTAKRVQRAKEALDFYADLFWEKSVQIDNRGFAKIKESDFQKIPLEIRLRVLSRALTCIGQSDAPLSMEALEKALSSMRNRFTLGHCHIITAHKYIFIAKEQARQPAPMDIPAKKWVVWDRFRIWSEQPAVVHSGTDKKKEKKIPYLVQQSFVKIEPKKTLEKNQKLDYNLNSSHIKTLVEFLTKKDI